MSYLQVFKEKFDHLEIMIESMNKFCILYILP